MAAFKVDSKAHPDSATAGIQEALDALPESGGTVLIPAGTYLLRRSVALRRRVTLRGEGAATVLARPPARKVKLSKRTLRNRARVALQHVSGLKVGDELLIRDDKHGGWNARHGIIREVRGSVVCLEWIEGNPEIIFSPQRNATASNLFPALWLPWADEAAIEDLTIDGGARKRAGPTGSFTVAAIHTRKALDVRITNVTVRNWPADGISVQKGSGAIVRGCLVENCSGIGFHPGSGLRNSIWVNNISRRNTHGLLFCQGVTHAVVQGNLFCKNAANGIFGLGDPDRFNSVLGNICADNGEYGIEAYKSLGNTIQGNIIRNNSQKKSGRFAGIYLETHRDNVVTGNICVDDQKETTQTRGIVSVNPAGDNIIRDNCLRLSSRDG